MGGYLKRRDWINISMILLLLVISYYKYQNRAFTVNQAQIYMDTLIEITVTSRDKAIDKKIEHVWNMIQEYELKFSYHDHRSVLFNINSKESPHDIDNDFFEILTMAKKVYHESNHSYDVSIGRLIDIWDFENETMPDSIDIYEALNYIGFDNVTFDSEKLFMPYRYKLNLGSIAKGYVIDKVIEYFIEQEVVEVSINAGGDMRFYSEKKKKNCFLLLGRRRYSISGLTGERR